MELKEAISSRFSARAFLDTPVPRKTIEEIIRIASKAPSSCNTQPWKVYVVSGKVQDELINAALASVIENGCEPLEYKTEPAEWKAPYNARRFETGMALYGAVGIDRRDKAARNAQMLENFRFFGAPVGLIFTIDKSLCPSQLGDLGMFMQNVMLLARDFGLHTCPQQSWQYVNQTTHRILEIPDAEMIYCGTPLGYIDPRHPANSVNLDRAPVESFTRFAGFED